MNQVSELSRVRIETTERAIRQYIGERVKIVAVEPFAAPTLHRAMSAGEPVDSPAGGIAAAAVLPPHRVTVQILKSHTVIF